MNNIKYVRLMGFRKFKDTTITFNEHLNIIVGENEAGKSTVVEAIEIVINQLYKNADKSIIKELINIEDYNDFKKHPSIENLPKIYIEVVLTVVHIVELNIMTLIERLIILEFRLNVKLMMS